MKEAGQQTDQKNPKLSEKLFQSFKLKELSIYRGYGSSPRKKVMNPKCIIITILKCEGS